MMKITTLPQTKTHTLKNGFTLVELLVVIAIIAVLAALSVPVLSSLKYKAGVTQTVSNLKQIGIVNHLYADDHHGRVNGLGKAAMPEHGLSKPQVLYWRVAAYLGADASRDSGELAYADVWPICEALHHPHIPANLTSGPDTRRWSVAANSEFRIKNGQFPRMNQYDSARIIYAVSGFSFMDVEDCENEQFLELPSARRRGPYYTKKKQLPCVYLDGSVRLETFPIDKDKFKPDYQE